MAGKDSLRRGAISVRGVERTRRVVEHVERTSLGGGGDPSARGAAWTPAIVRAKVTTAIPTGSLASPSSSGRAHIYYLVGGTWTEQSTNVTVYNDNTLTASIPVNRAVKLGWICGQWWLISASCS